MKKKKNRKPFHCKDDKQRRAIKSYYAKKAAQSKTADSVRTPPSANTTVGNYRDLFPKKFPFWARLRISKKRTALVIDEEKDEKDKIQFVHRETTSQYHKGLEEISPNPDKDKDGSMYLKRAEKKPIKLFEPHNKNLDMPEELRQRYDKNNHKENIPDDNDEDKKT